MTGVAAVVLGTGVLAGRWFRIDPVIVVAAVAIAVFAPLAAAAAAFLVWSIVRFRRSAVLTRDRRALEAAALDAGDLMALAMAGGLSTAAACRTARTHCPRVLRPELDRLIESMGRIGVVPALAAERGPLSKISGAIATATASGAPVLPALEAHLRQAHHRHHIERVEIARRLPIRLLVPLTLLVLPGFVLITVGPAVVDSLARLSP